jgi:tetratricopeptide (TPR) repeat protein
MALDNTLTIKDGNTLYRISFDPQLALLAAKLSEADLALYTRLYEQAQSDPREARAPLERFKEAHPHVPEAANLLTHVYIQLRQLRKAEALIRATYENHPHYLFGKINYAGQCLSKKQLSLIPAIFGGVFDLQALCPGRTLFHFSEFRGYAVFMGFYSLALGKREDAEKYHFMATRVDPHHPSVRFLGKRLFHVPWFKKLARKLARFR